MKKNLKEFTKKYIAGFITGLFIFGTIGVYAAAVFPSNQTTYDNSTTGMQATEVQGAIDELYNTCFPPKTAGEQIIENGNLAQDPYECRYFFTGASTNNYITFNNETWRIISIECDGAIKIMRNTNIDNRIWNSANPTTWNKPASLNTYLNETYYISLTTTAQSQIISHDWNIGSVTIDNNDLTGQINDENRTTWNGKIALVTASEYIRSNSNKSSCGTLSLNNVYYRTCQNTNWMVNGETWWTLSIQADSSRGVFRENGSGYLASNFSTNSYGVRPVVYLSSSIKITGGDGSKSNPYTIT